MKNIFIALLVFYLILFFILFFYFYSEGSGFYYLIDIYFFMVIAVIAGLIVLLAAPSVSWIFEASNTELTFKNYLINFFMSSTGIIAVIIIFALLISFTISYLFFWLIVGYTLVGYAIVFLYSFTLFLMKYFNSKNMKNNFEKPKKIILNKKVPNFWLLVFVLLIVLVFVYIFFAIINGCEGIGC